MPGSIVQSVTCPADSFGAKTVAITAATANNALILWANSDGVVTPTGMAGITSVDQQLHGSDTHTWIKKAAGGETGATFTPGTNDPIGCGIIEVAGVDVTITNIWEAHASAWAGSVNTVSPTATPTLGLVDFLIVMGFLHGDTNSTGNPGAPTFTPAGMTTLVNLQSLVDGAARGKDHYCMSYLAWKASVAAGALGCSVAWPTTWGADRTTFVIALKETSSGVTITGVAAQFTFTASPGTVIRDLVIIGTQAKVNFTAAPGTVSTTSNVTITGQAAQFTLTSAAGAVTRVAGARSNFFNFMG